MIRKVDPRTGKEIITTGGGNRPKAAKAEKIPPTVISIPDVDPRAKRQAEKAEQVAEELKAQEEKEAEG